MIKSLPWYYRKSKIVSDLYNVIQTALDSVDDDIDTEDLNLFITTASDFTLHEKDVGLSSVSADIETKRSRVLARIRGNSVLTVSELENLIYNYDKTGCTITEDYPNYTVIITFSGRTGVPYNLEQIKSAVEEVKPAHIKIEYAFVENTWGDVRRKLGTWGNAKAFTWGGVKVYDGRTWLYADDSGDVYLREDGANAYAVLVDDVPYARLL